MSSLAEKCVADYKCGWMKETDDGRSEMKSYGGFLKVKDTHSGNGLGAYLYILNAQLAGNK